MIAQAILAAWRTHRNRVGLLSVYLSVVRLIRAPLTSSACILIGVAPPLFVGWAIWSTGQMIHPIDFRLALGPWICLAVSLLGLALASVRLAGKLGPLEGTVLGIAVGFGVCEVMGFGYITLAVAFGIPAAP